jgi:hypothetical protein
MIMLKILMAVAKKLTPRDTHKSVYVFNFF